MSVLRFALWVLLGGLTAAVAAALQGHRFEDAAFLSFLIYQAILLAALAVLSGLALGYFAFFAVPPTWLWTRSLLVAVTAFATAGAAWLLLAAEFLTGIGGSPVLAGAVALYGLCIADMTAGMVRRAPAAI